MAYFAARDGMPAEYCRRRVRECDAYIGVIGFCWRSWVPGATSFTGLGGEGANGALRSTRETVFE